MKLSNISKLSSSEILEGSFGIEWESLRAREDGKLSLTPHPEIFGDKLTNPLITTDFSESQIEIITPAFNSIDEAFDTFSILSDLVNFSLPDDEYLWFQSIPCILPYWDQIPIARYPKEGRTSQKYREDLAKKYGVKKQMISGVHFNFSFSDNFLKKLCKIEESDLSFKEFKNQVYLKIARNYLRYCWLIIYLTGCSIGSHKTFSNDCIHLMDAKDEYGSYYSTKGPSFRNASCGYKNLKDLYPSYNSVEEFTKDINSFIENGDLSEAKELYTQIRLKPKNPQDLLNSLENDGIEYVEIRTLDINPFYQCGLVRHDMKFLHLFLIYLLIKDESDYADWQKEAKINEENTAELAYTESMKLIKDGSEITLKEWAAEIINEMYGMCEVLGIDEFNTLKLMHDRVSNPDLTYGQRLLKLIKENGYINTHVTLSKNNKRTSINNMKNIDLNKCEKYTKYVNVALAGIKSDNMELLRESDVIQWRDGESKIIKEYTVNDEYTYLFIDYLPPRKFTTYPTDLKDFAVGYCLGEGLIKDYSDIDLIKIDGTNILINTKLNHDPEEDLEQEGIIQERKGNCEHACVCRLLEYHGVNSDNAGGIRSELKTIKPNNSDLKINATQIIKDMNHLTDEAKIWQKTAGVHVAQLKYKDKIIIREDVSRHVAVDKVIGAAAKEGYDFSQCYISYSGRMPADMLIKVIRVGIPIIISNAAPASSGIDVADAGNITMIGFVKENRFTIYTAPERVDLEN